MFGIDLNDFRRLMLWQPPLTLAVRHIGLLTLKTNVMSKGKDAKKDVKKAPAKTPKEKRQEKIEKKAKK